jgi:hypothetical protein
VTGSGKAEASALTGGARPGATIAVVRAGRAAGRAIRRAAAGARARRVRPAGAEGQEHATEAREERGHNRRRAQTHAGTPPHYIRCRTSLWSVKAAIRGCPRRAAPRTRAPAVTSSRSLKPTSAEFGQGMAFVRGGRSSDVLGPALP